MKKSLVVIAVLAVFVFMFSFGCKKANPASPAATATNAATKTATNASTNTVTSTATNTVTNSNTATSTTTNTPIDTQVATSTPVSAPNLSGTITFPAAAIGRQYKVVVDTDANTANGNTSTLVGNVTSTSMAYAFNVPAGTYYVYAFVDTNNTGMAGPDGFDYMGGYGGGTWSTVSTGTTGDDFSCTAQLDGIITLNVTIPAAAAGRKGFFGIFNTKDYATLMGGSGPIAGSDWTIPAGTSFQVTFTVSAALAGSYYLLGFVDAQNQCPGSGGCIPVTGDYIAIYGGTQNTWPVSPNLTVDRDITLSFPLSTAVDNVSGTLTLPAAVAGKEYIVFVSPEKLGGSMTLQPVTKTAVASGASINYSLYVFVPGSYYIIAAVDNDGSGWNNSGNGPINDGDYVGIYGVPPPIINWSNPFPSSPNAVLPGSGLNITCQVFYQNGIAPTPSPVPTPSTAGGTGTISGTVTFPAGQAGKDLQVIVDMDLNPSNGNEVATVQITSIAGTTQSYTITGLPAGATYYVYGATMVHGSNGGPQIGDAVGVYGATFPVFPGAPNAPVTNGGTLTADITMVTAAPNFSGRVTMPSGASGSNWSVVVGTDIGGNGQMGMAMGTLSNSLNYFDYSLFLPLPGDYYVYTIVDVAPPYGGGPSCGDFLGIYNYPNTTHLTPAGPNVIDFNADMGAVLCP